MSDSLREQMLKAGFKETAKPKQKPQAKQHKQRAKGHTDSASKKPSEPSSLEKANIAQREAVAERKRVKAEIKTLIDANKLDKTAGDTAHSYVVGKRIKQMFVSDAVREKLVSGDIVITRLNGSTYLIPAPIGEQVRKLNPDWVVITPRQQSASDGDDEYADYQVPDDLTW